MKIKGISPLKGIKKWALEGALNGAGPQYSIAGTCIWANKSNPINSGVHVGGPLYSISSTCIWASKSNGTKGAKCGENVWILVIAAAACKGRGGEGREL